MRCLVECYETCTTDTILGSLQRAKSASAAQRLVTKYDCEAG